MIEENDIRPDKYKNEQQKCMEEDIRFLCDRKKLFVSVNCPSCGTENREIAFSKWTFEYCECSECRMLYMSPRPSESLLSEFYNTSKNYEYFNRFIFPSSIENRRKHIFIPRVDKIIQLAKKHQTTRNKLLEIGAGFGIFSHEMANHNFFKEVVGIEASQSLAETCRKKGIRIYEGILEELIIEEKFDIVVAFEVIEHIFDPKLFLEITNNILIPGGLLILTFPNYEGFDISVLGAESVAIDHEHLNYFNETSITLILEKSGYIVESIETPGQLDVDLVRKAIERGFRTNRFIRTLCTENFRKVGDAFQRFLVEHKLSGHMMVVAKKR